MTAMTAFWAFKTIRVFRPSGWAPAWPITVTTVASLRFGPASSALVRIPMQMTVCCRHSLGVMTTKKRTDVRLRSLLAMKDVADIGLEISDNDVVDTTRL
jgi:hypothetical protein